jgi:hypothetical protein
MEPTSSGGNDARVEDGRACRCPDDRDRNRPRRAAQASRRLSARDGISRHSGKSYVLDVYRFQGSTQQITALATGDLDIALLGFTSLPLAIENAGMTDLRALGEIRDGAPGYYSNKDSNAEIGHSTWVC